MSFEKMKVMKGENEMLFTRKRPDDGVMNGVNSVNRGRGYLLKPIALQCTSSFLR